MSTPRTMKRTPVLHGVPLIFSVADVERHINRAEAVLRAADTAPETAALAVDTLRRLNALLDVLRSEEEAKRGLP